ncbi:MAG: hypothetical protein JOZ13_08895 [Alphaproteobacteria bacterium]|nr:hypothetical protein [Alphaproteobacteria bacterium]
MRAFAGFGLIAVSWLAVGGAAAKDTILYTFKGGKDGGQPYGNLLRDANGNLFGTTYSGGRYNFGTVYKLAPDGTETVLWHFGLSDGAYPRAGMIADAQGDFYGTTTGGGADFDGTVFELKSNGHRVVLWQFTGGTDGRVPETALVRDDQGNLYGTTSTGGGDGNGSGVVFEVASSGQFSVLYTFTGGADGGNPYGRLLRDSNGNLFGTTFTGGANGLGTVFELTSDGQESVLHSFDASEGAQPLAGLIVDGKGNFIGSASTDGATGHGSIFKLAPSGDFSVLWACQGGLGGSSPTSDLIQDASGKFYGTTRLGGKPDVNGGVVFKLTPSGKQTVLHRFGGGKDGMSPHGVIMDDAGNLYGVTDAGGKFGAGVVYEVTP